MKRVLIAMALVMGLLLVACGGGQGARTLAEVMGTPRPDLESTIQRCTEIAIAEEGYTEAYARKVCDCTIHGLEPYFSAEKIAGLYDEEADFGDLADLGLILEVAYECMAR